MTKSIGDSVRGKHIRLLCQLMYLCSLLFYKSVLWFRVKLSNRLLPRLMHVMAFLTAVWGLFVFPLLLRHSYGQPDIVNFRKPLRTLQDGGKVLTGNKSQEAVTTIPCKCKIFPYSQFSSTDTTNSGENRTSLVIQTFISHVKLGYRIWMNGKCQHFTFHLVLKF